MRPRHRLRFEQLETRLTPASIVQFAGGSLHVTGDSTANSIILTESAGVVDVKIGATDYGHFRVTGSISVDAGNGNDTVSINVTDRLNGPITVLGNLGNDQINFNALSASAQISGLVKVDGGTGNDTVNINGGAFRLLMTDVYVTGSIGADVLTVQNADLQGNLIASGTDSVTIGQGPGQTPAFSTISGQVVISNAAEANPGGFLLTAGSTLGALTYIGGGGNDAVSIVPTGPSSGQRLPAVTLGGTVFGNTALILGGGSNSVITSAAELDGALTAVTGAGADAVSLSNGSLFVGSVNLYLGDGNNIVRADSSVAINGDLNLLTGNGNDNVTGLGQAPAFAANIGGAFHSDLGNGDNTYNFAGILGGQLTYRGGGGGDNVTVSGTVGGPFNIALGAGSDTFTFGDGFSTTDGGTLDFGYGTDTYNDGGIVVDFPLKLIDYP